MLNIILAVMAANSYMIFLIVMLLFAPRRKRDANGKVIFDNK